MRNVIYILSLTLLISACSKDKRKEDFRGEGLYTLEKSEKSSEVVYLRLESDRAIRYTVNTENNSYYWESLKYQDGKLNGKLVLEDATCLSSNKDKKGTVVEDLSNNTFEITPNGFYLDDNFFRKLSASEVDRLLVQLKSSSYECEQDGTPEVRTIHIEDIAKVSTPYLNPDTIKYNQLPMISGQVLGTKSNGFVQFILYSNKAYISYLFDESANTVSWSYNELLDETLTGRRAKLKISCPANHPLSSNLAKINKGNYSGPITPKNKYEMRADETTPTAVWLGDTKYQAISSKNWQGFVEQLHKAQVVCR